MGQPTVPPYPDFLAIADSPNKPFFSNSKPKDIAVHVEDGLPVKNYIN
jgi:hypothetical protein